MEYTLDELIIWLRANAAADISECALEDCQETVTAWLKDAARHNAIASALERLKALDDAEVSATEVETRCNPDPRGVVVTDDMKRERTGGRPSIYDRMAEIDRLAGRMTGRVLDGPEVDRGSHSPRRWGRWSKW